MSATVPTTSTQNVPAGPQRAAAKRPLTLEQEQFVREYTETYGFDRSQISFENERAEPIFGFDALSIMALRLSDISSIVVEPGDIEAHLGIATSSCEVKLPDGRLRLVFGSAMIGEQMPDAGNIEDLKQALDVSQARALRKGLRAVGWDPVRAHREWKIAYDMKATGKVTTAPPVSTTPSPEDELRKNELAEIHILAKELGLIDEKGDKTKYRTLIGVYFPGVESSEKMNGVQRSQLISTFRALKNSRANVNRALRANAEGTNPN